MNYKLIHANKKERGSRFGMRTTPQRTTWSNHVIINYITYYICSTLFIDDRNLSRVINYKKHLVYIFHVL